MTGCIGPWTVEAAIALPMVRPQNFIETGPTASLSSWKAGDDLVVHVVLGHVGADGAVAGLHLAPPLHDLLGVHVRLERRPHALGDVLALGVVEHVLGALADFLGVGEHPVDEVAELGAAHLGARAVRGGDALAAGARPARHELVALVAVGEHDGAGLDDDALAVDHPEADGAADALAVLEQVDDLDAVLEAHAELARVLGHVERQVLVEHRQAPRVLRQPAHVLGLAGVVAVDVHAPALEALEVGRATPWRSPAAAPGPRGTRRRCARGSRGRCRSRRPRPRTTMLPPPLLALPPQPATTLSTTSTSTSGSVSLALMAQARPAMPPPTISRSAESTVPRDSRVATSHHLRPVDAGEVGRPP